MKRVNVTIRRRPDSPILQLCAKVNGRELRRSARTTHMRVARKAADDWAAQLDRGIMATRLTWEQLTDQFADEYLPRLKPNTQTAYWTTIKTFGQYVSPAANVVDLGGSDILRWSNKLESQGLKQTTVAKHLRHLKAILNWAAAMELIPKRPPVYMPTSARKKRFAKGRALSGEEFQRMKDFADPEMRLFLDLLWLSGLRISEAFALSWDSPPVMVDMKKSTIVFHGRGQKSGHDEIVPMVDDLRKFLASFHTDNSTGPVSRPLRSIDAIKRRIKSIGESAQVQVSDSKHATAHDLRRSFGTRWALKVHPMVLKKLMRHETIDTTLKYYVDLDTAEIARQLNQCREG